LARAVLLALAAAIVLASLAVRRARFSRVRHPACRGEPTDGTDREIAAMPAVTAAGMRLFMGPSDVGAGVRACPTVLLLTSPTFEALQSQELLGSSERAADAATP